jgi:hypothetical protein
VEGILGLIWDERTREWRRIHKRGTSQSALLAKYYTGDQIKKNEIGKTCSRYRGADR